MMKRSPTMRFWLVPSAVVLVAPTSHAQPDVNGIGQERALAEQAQARVLTREWDELRAQVGEQEVTEPAKAIERYQEFLEARAAKNPAVAVAISLAIARVYRFELRDKEKALQVCDWALQQYAAFPGELAPIQREREALLKPPAAATPDAVRIVGAAPNAPRADVPAPIRIAGTGAPDMPAPIKINGGAAASPSAPGVALPSSPKLGATAPDFGWDTLPLPQAIEKLASMGESAPHAHLARSIIARGGDALQKPHSIPLKARLWLGEVLAGQGDERAPQVLGSLLDDLAAPVSNFSSQWLLFNGAENLARFYTRKQQHEKAAQTWMRIEPKLDKPNWMIPASLLGAGLAFDAATYGAKSRALLLRVPTYDVAWLSNLEKSDTRRAIITAMHITQASAVLEQATGADKANALALLSCAHLLEGNKKAAQGAADRALKYLQTLTKAEQAKVSSAESMAQRVAALSRIGPPAL